MDIHNPVLPGYWADPGQFDISIYNEGPHLQKKDGRYWLTWSNYDTRDPRYQIAYAFSGSVYGPYEVPENNRLTLASAHAVGTGHASLTNYGSDWYLLYHRLADPEHSLMRETCLGVVQFAEENTPFVVVD
ncbi:family 43 glycosylhydrolase [Paenibacillus borealis]|uniref:Glycosyl hydrolase family 43 n=1 Tax=Paenibacillus borealis TaxID=160799 RepID=A0A089MHC4_PAEBO|nr:family 43 glycosylhydrolase [Paenibacillus borealis]AIQ55964.1 hypothetical protein PBOR_02500 [Paenibacillus borealis]